MKKIYYFTYSYPYGLGESWKTEELTFFSDNFDQIIVVPYSFGGSKTFKGVERGNINYTKPLFETFENKKVWRQLISILIHRKAFAFFYEFFKNKVAFNRAKFIAWISSTTKIIELGKNERFNSIIQLIKPTDCAFFFWARETSEYLGVYDLNAKRIIRFHGYDLYAERYISKYIPYQEQQIKSANLVLCISENGSIYLKNKWTEYSNKIKLNKLGIVNDSIVNLGNKATKKDSWKIFTCSSLIPLKRMELLMEALILISDISIEWIHIGDGPEKKRIMELSNKLSKNVTFNITGWITKNEIFKLYETEIPDLFINLSTSEGLAVSIMEACSFGIPIIATNVGGTSEIVGSDNGILVDKDISAVELAAVLKLFTQKGLEDLSSWAQGSRNKFLYDFNAKNTKKELTDLINNL